MKFKTGEYYRGIQTIHDNTIIFKVVHIDDAFYYVSFLDNPSRLHKYSFSLLDSGGYEHLENFEKGQDTKEEVKKLVE